MIGTWEIVFTLFIVLLLFGGKRLPELAKSLGQGIREFKKASQDISEELDSPRKVETIDATPVDHKKDSNETASQSTAQ